MATYMLNNLSLYLGRNKLLYDLMKSHRFLVSSPLCETIRLKEWRRRHLASVSCNNIRRFTTSLTQNSKTYSESKKLKDQPISYSKSPAQSHKVDDTFQYDPRRLNSFRALVLCVGLFSSIIYFGFIRNETESEMKIFDWDEAQDRVREETKDKIKRE